MITILNRMMKKYLLSLGLAIVLLTSCNPDDGFIPKRVTEVNAFDLDNNGIVSDIRVDFIVTDNLNVTEYRVMVIPASFSNSFDQSVAVSRPRENFLIEFPVPFETEYTISRLPPTLLDVNGALIIDGVEYVVAILVMATVEGTVDYQLSEFSRPFTLRDQGIYGGYYKGSGCCLSGFGNIVNNICIEVEGNTSNYQGTLEVVVVRNEGDTIIISTIRFKVVGDIISDFIVSGGDLGDRLTVFNPGSGRVINDLTLEIVFVSSPSPSVTYEISARRTYRDVAPCLEAE